MPGTEAMIAAPRLNRLLMMQLVMELGWVVSDSILMVAALL
jgi:hypothetical protein